MLPILLFLLLIVYVLIDLTEFTGYPGCKNDHAHCCSPDKVEFVAQPQHTPLLLLPVAQEMGMCMEEVKAINLTPETVWP